MNRKILNFGVIALFAVGMILTSCGKDDDGGGGDDPVPFGNIGVKTKGIRSIKTTHYQAFDDGKGGVAKGNKTSMDIESYDEFGRVVEDKKFEFSGGEEVLTGKDVHSYNGGEWRTISYKYENNKYEKNSEMIMTFDSAGRLIEMEMLDANDNPFSKMVHHYDGNKLIETKNYNKDGKYVSILEYKFDGNLKEVTIYAINPDTGKKDEKPTKKMKILVDDKGNQIQVIPNAEDKQFKMSFELNDKGDLRRIIAENTDTGEESTAEVTYQYQYNERNHWIQKAETFSLTAKDFSHKEFSFEEREIEYY